MYAQVLCWIQLRFHEYWIELELTIAYVEPPRFAALYEAIRYRQWMRPGIPQTYLAAPKPSNSTSDKPDKEILTRPREAGKAKTETGCYVANTKQSAKLLERGQAVGKIAVFLKGADSNGKAATVPKQQDGSVMCLAWHIKGGCYSNCLRLQSNSSTHGPLNDAEDGTLCSFIEEGLEKIAKA